MTYGRILASALLAIGAVQSGYTQIAQSYVSRTVAGIFPIGDNGQAVSALLEMPQAAAADSAGNLYIADSGNNTIRKVSRNGVITSVTGYSGTISDLKLDPAGNLYIAGGNYAYKLTPAGVLSTIAGNGSFGKPTGDGDPRPAPVSMVSTRSPSIPRAMCTSAIPTITGSARSRQTE